MNAGDYLSAIVVLAAVSLAASISRNIVYRAMEDLARSAKHKEKPAGAGLGHKSNLDEGEL